MNKTPFLNQLPHEIIIKIQKQQPLRLISKHLFKQIFYDYKKPVSFHYLTTIVYFKKKLLNLSGIIALLFCTFFNISTGICSPSPTPLSQKQLTLEEAIEYALLHNRSLKKSELGLSSSELTLRSTEAEFDLKIVPIARIGFSSDEDNSWQIGAGLQKKFTPGPTISVNPKIADSSSSGSTDIAFQLNVPLLQGAGKAFTMDGVFTSLYAYQIAQLSFYSQQVSTVLQTVTAVYASIRSSLQIELLEKQLAKLKEHLALVKIKEKSGIISAIDLYRVEIEIKNVQDELTSFRQQHANNVDVVKEILAIPQSGEITLVAPVDYEPIKIDLDDALLIAQENRIEIEQSKRNVKESKRKVAIAKNKILPQLDFQLGYNLSDDETFDISEDSWTVSLNSDTNVFRTVEKNAYQQQRIQFRQSQLDLVSAEENINQQVRAELNSLEKQLQRINIRKEQVGQTIGKLKLAESKFQYGMASNFDLIEAQTEFQRAQTNYLFERIGYITGMYRLRSVLGTMLERQPVK